MKKNIKLTIITILFLPFFSLSPVAYAAEVYYLGGGGIGSEGTGAKNKQFTLEDRVDDLLDFKSYGEYGPERSGRISGNIFQEVNWNSVSGNGSKSFLRKGVYQLTELNLNVQERLWSDYNLESQFFFRKTDDRRIEPRKDIRLKQFDVKVYNEDNLVQFGDFYGDFSQFVLGSSLEGFNVELSHNKSQRYKMVAARRHEADDAADLYARYVFGGKAEYVFRDESDFPLFRIGVQAVTSQDDSGSIDKVTSAEDMNNSVVSLDGEIRPAKDFSVVYELAQSVARNDQKDRTEDLRSGIAFRIQPTLKIDDFKFKYLYYYVTPKFYTDAGSAMSDKEQHQFTADWRMNKYLTLSFIENLYWDHLKGSSRNLRTINDQKYMTAYFRPFTDSSSFAIRSYVNLLNVSSDDINDSLKSKTNTYGVSVNDSLMNGRITYGTGYEYRQYIDLANSLTGSDIYNRINGNIGIETELFGRRFYFSDDISLDFRATKTDTNPEVTVGNSFFGTYEFHKLCTFRFGNNVQHTDAAGPSSNFTNTKNYGEFIFQFKDKRSPRITFRLEENVYKHEDSSQNYTEDRATVRVSSNF